MRTKLKGLVTLLLALVVQFTFAQQKKVTGTVTDAQSGEPLPGVNVVIKGTQNGTVTDFDGKFSITASPDDVLVFSYIGYQDKEEKVGNRNVINVALTPGEELKTVVIDISGEKKEVKTLSYAVQNVKAEKLEISDISNVEGALAGKVAGAQVWEQAGSKLGYAPKVRIRGRIALSTDSDPLYVVDGVPVTDPSFVDPDNVANIEVLKGPNATAIYGQRGENGVVVITTKSAKTGKFGVDVSSKITFEKIAYLPKYQNDYGEGYGPTDPTEAYNGEYYNFAQYDYNDPVNSPGPIESLFDAPGIGAFFAGLVNTNFAQYPFWNSSSFIGKYYNATTFADESWGPKFDGRDIIPWYAWWPDSPYFGQTAKWEAKPNNIKNFYDTGVYIKNNVSLYSGTDKYAARLSFSNLSQKGTVPYSTYNRYYINSNFDYNVSDKFKVGLKVLYSTFKRHGDFNDDYANQTSGSFNQWFARDLDMDKQRELIDLKTPEGYFASWNWFGPYHGELFYSLLGYSMPAVHKPVFWFNHYTWLDRYDRNGFGNDLSANVWATYKFNDNLKLKFMVTRSEFNRGANFHLPYEIEYSSAHDAFISYINSFGDDRSKGREDNYNAFLNFNKELSEDFKIDGMLGTTFRDFKYDRIRSWMDFEDIQNGLIIPDVYRFDNTKKPIAPALFKGRKQVFSLFGKTTLSYKNMLFLEATARQDWSSALFANKNGYFYPSVGLTFNFTELDAFENLEQLNFGKFRIGWAQVGSDVSEHLIFPRYPIQSDVPYQGYATLLTPSYFVDPNLTPAINSSFETGMDLEFMDSRYKLSFTYYYEKRNDEIIFQTVTGATGYSSYLTNGGQSHRSGIEVSLDADVIKSEDFTWNLGLNFNKNKTIIDEVPGDAKEMVAPGGRWWSDGDTWGRITLVHVEGEEWGQIKGYGIEKDDNGNPVLTSNGLYVRSQDQIYYGSVLPDYTGGFTSLMNYKNFKLAAHFTFQKGGKFYSGTEIWGQYSGLLEETGLNGNREGGKKVEGVDAGGNSVSFTVNPIAYFKQFHNSDIVEPFIHDASYLKLRELSLTYTLPKKVLGKYLKGASVSVIGTNLWLIAVSKDNVHRWDPSELSQAYGEDGQLPGTKRFGMSFKLSF